jgi:RimJ/RimL family protein N-acetyltransferase
MKQDDISKNVTLRDGTVVLIRSTKVQDGQALEAFFRSLPEEDRQFLRDDVTKPGFVDAYVGRFDYDRVIPIVAEHEGEIVSEATLYRTHHGWTSHVGVIRMVVGRSFQHRGLGTEMARVLVKVAISLALDKLVAEVVDNQVGAMKAFEKLGFQHEATLKGHVKDIYGRRRDLFVMTNDVSYIWEAMESLVEHYMPSME